MRHSRPGTPDETTNLWWPSTATAGAAIAIASVAPIAIGCLTMTTHMSAVPFNFSVGVFVVIWVAAVCHHYCAELIKHMNNLNKTELKQVGKLRKDVLNTDRKQDIARLAEVVDRADQRALRSVE